ncbi:MAG: Unknown protein [uncultured Sulfurovum sp.]|uniref:Uncharacterized protein n=1 Tax=uncultured Sulfurovum sp. TaxID=269237 RepID=A0A6S6SA20_9BACT|nr:MAG: Unknown protein [uncultured Sulfurovum sp.]
MPFQTFSKSLKKNFKKIISRIKYGDDHRLPLAYLETYSRKPSSTYELPQEIEDKPLEYYKAFPQLSKEILVAFFGSIGVRYVPEVTMYELAFKTPRRSFEDFCITFAEDEGLIDSFVLNRIIGRLRQMDGLRSEEAFDSRPVYTALENGNLEEVDRLLTEMKKSKNEKDR